jgi:hypothetical protein
MFVLGNIVGTVISILLIALFRANKVDDIEQEKLERYKQGYEKGFKDGSGQQKTIEK